MGAKSQAQWRWLHTDSAKQALGAAGVKEWEGATKSVGALPEKKKSFHEGGLVGKAGGTVEQGELVIPKKVVDKMPGQDDGGVTAKLNAAKSALSSAGNFAKSVTGKSEMPAAKPVALAPVAKPAPSTSDELKAKADNVNQYAAAAGKPLGSFKKGTDSVPKTGVYKLHAGEKVTPAGDNKSGDAKTALNSAGKKKKKKGSIHIKPTDNDGFVVDHDADPDSKEPMSQGQTHAIASVDDLVKHIQQKYGQGAQDDVDTQAQAASEAQQAAASPAPAAVAPPAGPAGGAPQGV